MELWAELDSFSTNDSQLAFSIHGSPGVGKSSETWAWASNAWKEKKNVLWVHVDKLSPAVCVQCMKDSEADIVILDGYEHGMHPYDASF